MEAVIHGGAVTRVPRRRAGAVRAPAQRGPGVERFGLPTELAALARPAIDPLTEQITRTIQDRVVQFGGHRSEEVRWHVERAVRAGISSFVDMLGGGPRHSPEVDEIFESIGYEEAVAGRSLEHLRATMLVGTHAAWRAIHRQSREYQVPDGLLGRLGDALFAHMDHLEQQMNLGHLRARMELEETANQWRGALVSALLAGDRREAERRAASTGWRLPDQVEVLAVQVSRRDPFPDTSSLPDTLLVHLDRPVAAVIGAADELERHRNRILAVFGRKPSAVCWPVPVTEAAAGLRWATRALEMRAQGLIADTGLIRCADHVELLWVHSEPLLRDLVMRSELAPLMSVPERTRLVLVETLLALLETHGSAPALAQRLGVHPQTIRYRLRRLRELLGDRLDAPGQNLALLLALRASLPMWRGAPQPDDGERRPA